MAVDDRSVKPEGMSEAALRREAERAALREARLAEALRSNLKRRKAQIRGRTVETSDPEP